VPDRYRPIAGNGWTLAATNSAVRAPNVGDVGRWLRPPVAAERVHDKPSDVLVPGDTMTVNEDHLNSNVGQRLAWIYVEEESLVEDCD